MNRDKLRKQPQDRSRVRTTEEPKEYRCSHEYQWIETVRSSREADCKPQGLVEYELVDRFYCKFCLDITQRSKKAVRERKSNMPGWF